MIGKKIKLPKWAKSIPIVLLLLGSDYCQSQTKKLDSLLLQINQHQKRDTVRVKLIIDYALNAANDNTTKLLPYLNEAVNISKEKKYLRGLQTAYLHLQIYYSDRGDVEKAKVYGDTAMHYLKNDASKLAMTNLAWLHNNMAGDYAKLGDYQQAINNLIKAATIFERYDPKSLAATYGNIALMYAYLLLPERAMEYDKKAIAAAEKTGDILNITRRNLGYTSRLIDAKKYSEAEQVLDKIEPFVMKLDNSSTYIFFYQSRGLVSKGRNRYDEAVSYLKKAYGYTLKNDDKLTQTVILDPLADVLQKAGRQAEAKQYLDTLLAKSLTYKIRDGELNAYRQLADWYGQKKDYRTANTFLLKRLSLSDSLSSEETKEKISMMEARFKVQGKDKEIKILQDEKKIQQLSLRQKSTLNYILAGGALVLIAFALLSYRNYRHRQKLQQQRITELETEKQLAATEAVLKGEEQERSRLAKDLHDGLGGMLSGIKLSLNTMKGNLIMTSENADAFEMSIGMLDNTIKEMRRVAHNMMPEMLVKYGLDTALKELCAEISRSTGLKANYQSLDMDKVDVEQSIAIAIYRIVQELSGNAIKHSEAKNLLVQIHALPDEKQLAITVEDDGKGFDPQQLETTTGMGWMNIRNRIDFLKGKLDIHSAPGGGTSVLLEINY